MFSPLEQFNVISLISLELPIKGLFSQILFDVSFLNILLPLVIILIIIIYISNLLLKQSRIIPLLLQYIIENVTEFIFSIVKQQLGKKGYVFFPLIYTIFNFILLSNYLSLLPMGIALTSQIIVTLCLSCCIRGSIFIYGLLKHGLLFFKLFVPTCPFALLPMLILIELFSYFLRSFSLAIRLSANILAGHTLVYIISMLVFALVSINIFYIILGFLILFPVLVLESAIAFMQAYVYCTLVCLYLKEVLSSPNH